MDYITVWALRQEVKTELSDEALQAMIRRASAAITRALGMEPSAEPVTERFRDCGIAWLAFVPAEVQSVVESGVLLSPEEYIVDGRMVYKPGGRWRDVTITYTIGGLDGVLALCEQVCVEIVKHMIAQDGYASQRVGDWSGEQDPKAWSRALGKLRRWRPVMA